MKKNISLVICAVYLLCLFSVSAEAVQTNPTYKEHETAVEMLTSSSEEAVPEETRSEETSAEMTEEVTSAGVPEETTSAEVPEETTSAALPEETTSEEVPEETTSAASPEETTSAEQPEETTSISEETTTAVTPEETTTVPPEETTVAAPTAAPEEATPSNATAAIDEIISLKVPNSIDFLIDQYGLKREAQIYSQQYTIRNNGSMRILAKFTDIRCMVADDIISVDDEWSDEEVRESEEKVIKLVIHMSNGDAIMVTEQASEYQLLLEPGEEVIFTIEGCLGGTIHNQWQTGDVLIELVYGAEQY